MNFNKEKPFNKKSNWKNWSFKMKKKLKDKDWIKLSSS